MIGLVVLAGVVLAVVMARRGRQAPRRSLGAAPPVSGGYDPTLMPSRLRDPLTGMTEDGWL